MNHDTITRLEADVRSLAVEGGRPVGSPGHSAAQQYLIGRLKDLRLCPYRGETFALPYQHGGNSFVNLVGRIPANAEGKNALLVGAHYDTCGNTPGADDNAAAVAILFEITRLLQNQPRTRDIIVAVFDAEEPPYFLTPAMGSIRFYEDQQTDRIDCAFIMDLVGHDVPVPGLENGLLQVAGFDLPDAIQPGKASCMAWVQRSRRALASSMA
jgi:hypothetical protein